MNSMATRVDQIMEKEFYSSVKLLKLHCATVFVQVTTD
jgi:hypothetical protein